MRRPSSCSVLLGVLLLGVSISVEATADDLYHVDSVSEDGDVVRVYASADLGPVEAVVRENAHEAVARAAPDLLRNRDFGAYRLREPRIVVQGMHFSRGGSAQEVDIDIDAVVTAERDDRGLEIRDYLPTVVFRPRGRVQVARARLVVGVRVAIADGRAVVLRILGRRLHVSEPLELDLDLEGRVLHTHAQPIPAHPSLSGLVPEATALRGIDGNTLRFTVRFRRTS